LSLQSDDEIETLATKRMQALLGIGGGALGEAGDVMGFKAREAERTRLRQEVRQVRVCADAASLGHCSHAAQPLDRHCARRVENSVRNRRRRRDFRPSQTSSARRQPCCKQSWKLLVARKKRASVLCTTRGFQSISPLILQPRCSACGLSAVAMRKQRIEELLASKEARLAERAAMADALAQQAEKEARLQAAKEEEERQLRELQAEQRRLEIEEYQRQREAKARAVAAEEAAKRREEEQARAAAKARRDAMAALSRKRREAANYTG